MSDLKKVYKEKIIKCPWDKFENEDDGHYKNFAAWERWMEEEVPEIRDDMEIYQEVSLYSLMIDLLINK